MFLCWFYGNSFCEKFSKLRYIERNSKLSSKTGKDTIKSGNNYTIHLQMTVSFISDTETCEKAFFPIRFFPIRFFPIEHSSRFVRSPSRVSWPIKCSALLIFQFILHLLLVLCLVFFVSFLFFLLLSNSDSSNVVSFYFFSSPTCEFLVK